LQAAVTAATKTFQALLTAYSVYQQRVVASSVAGEVRDDARTAHRLMAEIADFPYAVAALPIERTASEVARACRS
jgi:hypothetical protein